MTGVGRACRRGGLTSERMPCTTDRAQYELEWKTRHGPDSSTDWITSSSLAFNSSPLSAFPILGLVQDYTEVPHSHPCRALAAPEMGPLRTRAAAARWLRGAWGSALGHRSQLTVTPSSLPPLH